MTTIEKERVGWQRAQDLHQRWKETYGAEWRGRGCGGSADGYAEIVAQHRSGTRTSLSYGYLVGNTADDSEARKQIREEIDAINPRRTV